MIQTLMMQFLSPLFFLGSMYRSFEDNLMDIRQITKILQTPANVQEGTKSLPQLRGDVAFEQVSFKYLHDAENILDKLSFTVKENAFIAIVGRSGIGKTTILNLLFRLYDPLEGKVTIDGYDLR